MTFSQGWITGLYRTDRKTRSAVERELQIITEAAIRLGSDAEKLCPGLDWKGFRGMGNVLRHEYHRVDDEIVWETVKAELPPLRKAVLKALESIRNNRLYFTAPSSQIPLSFWPSSRGI